MIRLASDTALERTEKSVETDLVVTAQTYVAHLDSYDPRRMTREEYDGLVDRGVAIKAAYDHLCADEKEITGPFERGLKAIRERFRPIKAQLKDGLEQARNIATQCRDELTLKANRAAALKQQAALVAHAEARTHPEEPAAPPADFAAPVASNIHRSGTGAAIGRQDLRVKAVDWKLLAEHHPELLQINVTSALALVRDELKRDPEAQVPGLEWWREASTNFRRSA